MFLSKVISTYASTEEERKTQTELIERTIEAGASINNALQNIFPSLNHLSLLEQNYFDKTNKELFLSKVLGASTSTEEDKKTQRELIEKAINAGANINNAFKKAGPSLNTLQFLEQNYFDKIDKDLLLNKVISSYASTEEERKTQRELIEKAINAGANINNAFKKAGPSLNTLQFLEQNYFDKIDKDLFLSKVLSAYTSTEENKKTQKELIEKTIKAGANISNAFKKSAPSLNNLQLLEQQYFDKVDQDLFLSKVLSAYTLTEEDKKTQKELFVKALDTGATVKKLNIQPYGTTSAVQLILEYKDKIINKHNAKAILNEFLKFVPSQDAANPEIEEAAIAMITEYNIPIPIEIVMLPFSSLQKFMQLPQYSLNCNRFHDFLDFNGFAQISYPEAIIDYKYRNLRQQDSGHTKIPAILHHIWLTKPNNPGQIRSQDIDNAIKTHKLFQNSTTHSWQQIIWVNNIDVLQPSVAQLANTNIVVREYSPLKPYLLNYDLVEKHIKLSHWGIASDTLRYDLVKYMGGLYADINYIFNRVPDKEINSFDFFSVTYSEDYVMSIDNFLFAAKPNHPVIVKTQQTVRENIVSPSLSLAKLYNESVASFTDKATADPIGNSYFKAAHKDGNIDVVFPKPPSECDLSTTCTVNKHIDKAEDQATFNLLKLCPEFLPIHIQQEQQETYTESHEICPLQHDVIGHDSSDGRTWDERG